MSEFTKEDKHLWEPIDTEGKSMVCKRCGMEISFPSWEWDEEIGNVCRVALKKTGNWKKANNEQQNS